MREPLDQFVQSPGYLKKTGWLRSMEEGQAVDADGEAIPWLTYPAIDFLAERIRKEMTVFEYGSGNSTFWWSRRVSHLISCEHDKEWYAEFSARVPSGITYLLRRAKGGDTAYSDEILNYKATIDILVVDGRDRVNCIRNGVGSLVAEGVVIIDNSDREEYQEGYAFLLDREFKRLDFWGMGALSTRRWCTSVFYRANNCLYI